MQIPFEYFVVAFLIGVLILCFFVSVSDFRHRKIPNRYLVYALIYLIAVYIAMFYFLDFSKVFKGMLFSILASIMGGFFLYYPYKLKQVGAGDVKLIMVIGLFVGFKGTIMTILFGAMVGGVWALALAWKYGGLSHMWYNIKFMVKSMYLSGFKDMGWDLRSNGAIAMPYGVALCIGCSIIAIEQLILYANRIQSL